MSIREITMPRDLSWRSLNWPEVLEHVKGKCVIETAEENDVYYVEFEDSVLRIDYLPRTRGFSEWTPPEPAEVSFSVTTLRRPQ